MKNRWLRWMRGAAFLAVMLPVRLYSAPAPVLEGVEDHGNGTYTAWFGYNLPGSSAATVLVGANNTFAPAPADRGQTTAFSPGRWVAAFGVNFDGSDLTWTLHGASVTANASSPPFAFASIGERLAGIVRHRPAINGKVDGSVEQLLSEDVTLNGGAVVAGDLLVPGSPQLRLNGQPNFGGRVQGDGAATPDNRWITLSGNATLRYLVTRVDPVTMPDPVAVVPPAGTRSVNINSPGQSPGDFATLKNLTLNGHAGAYRIPPGAYGNFIANGGSGFVLGTEGAAGRDIYDFQNLTLNGNAFLRVDGPVEIHLKSQINHHAVFGDSAHPEYIVLKINSGGLTLHGGARFYGHVEAPAGHVIINGNALLVGTSASDHLTIHGNGELRFAPRETEEENQPPAGQIEDISVPQDAPPFVIDLRAAFDDPDNTDEELAFTLSSNSNAGLVTPAIDSATGMLTLTLAAGQYGTAGLVIRATDPGGLFGEAAFTLTVIRANQPPAVAITSPAAGAILATGSTVAIEAGATDPDDGVREVEFFVDGASLGLDTSVPYGVSWPATASGTFTLTAIARDHSGASASSAPITVTVNAAPVVVITSPTEGAVVTAGDPVAVTADASDPDGSIVRVELWVDGVKVAETSDAPYTLAWPEATPGAHTLTVVAIDNLGTAATSAPVTIRANQAPQVSLTAPAEETDFDFGTPVSLAATATDPDGSITRVQFFATIGPMTFAVGEVTQAPFTVDWTPALEGDYTLTAVATDNDGAATTSAEVRISVVTPLAQLVEGSDFLQEQRTSLVIPADLAVLVITFRDLAFDLTDQVATKDAFEIALLGADGSPIVEPFAEGRDAFFNVTESASPLKARGVAASEANGVTTVFLDVTGLAPGTPVTVVARLVNNDADEQTSVYVGNVRFEGAMPEPAPATIQEVIPSPPVDPATLQNISNRVALVHTGTSFHDGGEVFWATVAAANTSTGLVRGNVAAVVTGVSDPSVSVVNADGLTADGKPYFDFSGSIPGGVLAAQAVSLPRSIAFANPGEIPFSFSVVFLGQPNRDPVFETTPECRITVGNPFHYEALAVDPDGDAVTYSLVAGPGDMTVNAETGQVDWTAGRNAHLVILRAEDGLGGFAEQAFVLDIPAAPNRPPVIVSSPGTSATTDASYSYQAQASDADNDSLMFSLETAPAGMAIDAASGLISWVPSFDQVDLNFVTVKVVDGNHGVARQSFQISVARGPGNQPPIFTSNPVTTHWVNGFDPPYYYDASAIDPDGDPVAYSITSGPPGMTIDSQTGVLLWPNAAGSAQVAIAASDGQGHIAGQSFLVEQGEGGEGNMQVGVIFHDLNRDGIRDQDTEPGIEGRMVYIDLNYNGSRDPGEPFAVSDSGGNYLFARLETYRTFLLRQELPSGWRATTIDFLGFVPSRDEGAGIGIAHFGSVEGSGSQIRGLVWHDLNQDGQPQLPPLGSETGVPGATVILMNEEGSIERRTLEDDPQTPDVDETGAYDFSGLKPGTYTVYQVPPRDYYQTYPSSDAPLKLIGIADEGIVEINASTGETTVINNLQLPSPRALTYDSLGRLLAIVQDNVLVRIDLETSTVTVIGAVSGFPVVEALASHRGVLYAAASADADDAAEWLISIDPDTAEAAIEMPFPETAANVEALDIRDDGLIYAASAGEGLVYVYIPEYEYWEIAFSYTEPIKSMVFAPNLGFYANTAVNGMTTLAAYDGATFAPIGATGFHITGLTVPPGQIIGNAYYVAIDEGEVLEGLDFGNGRGPNEPPYFASEPPAEATAAGLYTYDAEAGDPNNDPLVFDLVAAPAGMVVDPGTGAIFWTPGAAQEGTHQVTLRVADDRGGEALQPFQIVVAGTSVTPNRPPLITSIPSTLANVGLPYSYQVVTSDADGHTVAASLVAGPAGMTISSGGLVSWTPAANQATNFQVTIRATDGHGGITDQTFTIASSVRPNHPPVITSAPVVVAYVGAPYVYQAVAGDSDCDPITFALVSGPSGLTASTGGAVSWTPSSAQVGSHTVTLSAHDGFGGTARQSFTVVVRPAAGNHSPVFVSSPLTAFNLVSGASAAYSYFAKALDADGDVLTYTLSQNPPGATIDPAAGRLSWQPGAAGSFDFVVQTTDGKGGVASQAFTVAVASTAANADPVINSQPPTRGNPGKPYVYRVLASDPDGQALAYALTQSPGGMSIDPATGVITWSPGSANLGAFPVSIRVTDNAGGEATQQFTLSVTSGFANADPQITSAPAATATIDSPYVYQTVAVDADGDALTYSLNVAPEGMVIDPETGLVHWLPQLDQAGPQDVLLKVEDARGGVALQGFQIAVAEYNTPPVFLTPSLLDFVKLSFARNLSLQAIEGGYPAGEDLILGNVTFDIPVGGPNIWHAEFAAGPNPRVLDIPVHVFGVSEIHTLINTYWGQAPNAGTFAYVEFFGSEGAYHLKPLLGNVDIRDFQQWVWTNSINGTTTRQVFSIQSDFLKRLDKQQIALPAAFQDQELERIRISDYGGTNFQRVMLSAASALTPRSSNVAVLKVDSPFRYAFPAQDAEGDTIQYGLKSGPAGISLDTSTAILSWTPTALGAYPVVIEARDGRGGATELPLSFRVLPDVVNYPPKISSSPRTRVRAGAPYYYVVDAYDPNGDSLAFNLVQAPAGMEINSSGFIAWQPAAGQMGGHAVSISVSDGRAAPVTQNFTVKVAGLDSNAAPVIDSAPRLAAIVDRPYLYDIEAADPDGDPLVFRFAQAPAGMSIHPLRGTIRWLPRADQIGNHDVAIEVLDSFGGLAEQSFTVNVRAGNAPPLITSSPEIEIGVGQNYVYPVQAADPDGDGVSFGLVSPPSGMTISSLGIVQWTPASGQAGSVNVTVRATDEFGGATDQTYALLVSTSPVNLPPLVNETPLACVHPGSAYEYQLQVSDPDGGAITYSLARGPAGLTVSPTGLIQWQSSPGQSGYVPVTILAADPNGKVTVISFSIRVAPNNNPVAGTAPAATALAGGSYHQFLSASDPDGDRLSFSVVQAPPGFQVDSFGRLTWAVPGQAAGIHPVEILIKDGCGGTATLAYEITVVEDTELPAITLLASDTVVPIGRAIQFQVRVFDNGRVEDVVLTRDGVPVVLDELLQTSITFTAAAVHQFAATVTDGAGNTSTATREIRITDPADAGAPEVALDETPFKAPAVPITGIITAPTPITATVQDDHLEFWRVEIGPADLVDLNNPAASDPDYRVLASGATNISNQLVGQVDPTTLANGSYYLRIIARDFSGNTNAQGLVITIEGDLKLGRFTYAVTDLNIPLAGIPIQITRVYDTLEANRSGDFGFGWKMAFREARIQESVPVSPLEAQGIPEIFGNAGNSFKIGTRVSLTNPDGRRVNFRFIPVLADLGVPGLPPGAGFFGTVWQPRFVPEPGTYDRLEAENTYLQLRGDTFVGYLIPIAYNPSVYTLTRKDGTKYVYDQFGGLRTITDRNQNVVTFSRNGVFHSSGAAITFTRDAAGRITKIIDPDGKEIQYEYSPQGDLKKVTDQAGLFTAFTYLMPPSGPAHYLDEIRDSDGNPVSKITFDASGRLDTITDGEGNVTTLIYDTATRTETRIHPAGLGQVSTTFDERGNVIHTFNEIGAESSNIYADSNNPDSPTQVTPPCGCTTRFTYDSRGNALTETTPKNETTRRTFDAFGNLLSVTDAQGKTTRYQYDSEGNLTSLVDGAGNTTRIAYDDLGRANAITDALGRVTAFEHDEGDPADPLKITKPTKVTRPDGSVLRFKYNQWGSMTEAIDENGSKTELITDDGGRLMARRDALGKETTYAYYPSGQLQSVTDSLGKTTSMEYDGNFRLVKRTDPNGGITRFTYDERQRLKQTIDPLDRVTERFYRADGVVEKIRQPDGTEITFEHDTNGRRTALVDPGGNRTEFVHDGNNRITAQTDPLGKVSAYEYDPAQNLSATTDRLGRVRRFGFDAVDRLTRETWLQSGAVVKEIALAYDPAGNLVSAADDVGSFVLTYDNRNRLHTVTASYAGRAPFMLTYGYDAGSRVTSVTDNYGVRVESNYDVRNLPTQLKWSGGGVAPVRADMAHNDLGDMTEVRRYADLAGTQLVGKTAYTYGRGRTDKGFSPMAYNAQGDRPSLGDLTSTEGFGPLDIRPEPADFLIPGSNPLQRITEISHTNASGDPILENEYQHDLAGQLSTDTSAAETIIYTHDVLGQLRAATRSAQSNESYAFDSNGNRLRTGSQTTDNIVSTSNRITNDGTHTFAYDDEGNVASKTTTATGEKWVYSYDHRNRLTQAQKQASSGTILQTVVFTYDLMDRRIAKTVDGQETTFLYSGDNVWSETPPGGQTTHYLSSGVDQWIARHHSDSGTEWYLSDRMGTVKGITDSGGTLINRTEYDSFGGILSHSNPAVADRFGFTGREHDPETGLIYYRARWYEPSLGRFLSEDSVGFAAADTNLRRYVFGSPMMGVDPSGLITTADYAKLKSAVVAAGKQCAQALGITLAEKGVEIGIYMFLAEAQVYVGQTLDDFDVRKNRHIARLKDQGIKLVKEAFEPILRVAPGTAKAKIRELEEFFIKYLVRNLEEIERTGSANILNRRHEIKKGTKLSCDDFVDKVL